MIHVCGMWRTERACLTLTPTSVTVELLALLGCGVVAAVVVTLPVAFCIGLPAPPPAPAPPTIFTFPAEATAAAAAESLPKPPAPSRGACADLCDPVGSPSPASSDGGRFDDFGECSDELTGASHLQPNPYSKDFLLCSSGLIPARFIATPRCRCCNDRDSKRCAPAVPSCLSWGEMGLP